MSEFFGLRSRSAVMEGIQGDHYDIPVASFHWDFGDGSRATGSETSHTYARAGTYEIVLLAVWEDGSEMSFTRAIEVG